MPFKITQTDAFTHRPFHGNPAAVCILPAPQTDQWKRAVAREMNLSETAYLERVENGFRLRWFTPVMEVDLCGHATLASAHVLWEEGQLSATSVARFYTRSGLLTATLVGGWIAMDFPALGESPAVPPAGLIESLGIDPVYVGRSRFDYLLEVSSEEIVRDAKPDFSRLSQVEARGVILTSKSSGQYDFVSRFFAPRAGVQEDPVTGSAHCCLGPYWSKRLKKAELKAFQASPRGGEMKIEVQGERVLLSGQAVTVLRGELVGDQAAGVVVEPVLTPAELDEIKALFQEYAGSLNFSLCFQGFDRELAGLPGEYAPPAGVLLLARTEGRFAGCVALRRLGDDVCEMKRLYVRPEFRGKDTGRELVRTLFNEARRRAYQVMRLDTVPIMKEAIGLYRSLGFREIQPYRENPVPGAVFMEIAL
ncbi:MAG TPA: PhzF family phenazine biosynthesis isomerase [Terriglobia bacterium]|nr:PhzF family phenazine biosynthesis isomerase [Terriglobia bacterium]